MEFYIKPDPDSHEEFRRISSPEDITIVDRLKVNCAKSLGTRIEVCLLWRRPNPILLILVMSVKMQVVVKG